MYADIHNAGVAELADALDLGSSTKCVGVQVPSPAPIMYRKYMRILCSIYNICFFAGVAQMVERHLAKVDVAGSSPVFRSMRV